jgi:hypothetical protein
MRYSMKSISAAEQYSISTVHPKNTIGQVTVVSNISRTSENQWLKPTPEIRES